MNREFYEKIMTDRAFRAEFMSAPTAVFTKYSIDMYKDKKIEVHENTRTRMHYALLPEGTDLEGLNVPEEFKRIQKKAWEDKSYLEMLLTDPKNAVTQIMGSIPESVEINFYAYDPKTAHVVLPALNEETDELSDDDLEMVAGGKGGSGRKILDDVDKLAEDIFDAIPDGVTNGISQIGKKGIGLAKDLGKTARNFFSGW